MDDGMGISRMHSFFKNEIWIAAEASFSSSHLDDIQSSVESTNWSPAEKMKQIIKRKYVIYNI